MLSNLVYHGPRIPVTGDPMKTYIGRRLNSQRITGHYVMVHEDDRPPKILYYNNHYGERNWDHTEGLQQLALDLLSDALEEEDLPPGLFAGEEDVEKYAKHSLAWLPHRHYALVLGSITNIGLEEQWSISQQGVLDWYEDWCAETHHLWLVRRYQGRYRGVPFSRWAAEFSKLLENFGVKHPDDVLFTKTLQMQLYLGGYTPEGAIVHWTQHVLKLYGFAGVIEPEPPPEPDTIFD